MKQGQTTFLLIRHGAHVLGGGTVAGRSAVAVLSPLGQQQAARTAERVAAAKVPVRAIYSSPVVRTRQTAQPLADRLGLPVQVRDALAEIDFGEWAGRALDELRPEPGWQQWNAFRSGARAPAGERMLEVQSRVVHDMLDLCREHPDEVIALVTHGDVIRAAVAYFLGIPLDLMLRFEISLASISVVAVGDWGPWVLSVNNTGDELLPWPP